MPDRATVRCPGCGVVLPAVEGPVHRYMTASPACWAAFGAVLAAEYSDPALLPTHRLSVDAYAVQHPGDGSRQAVQSVGLHLARLMLQLDALRRPEEANELMLRLGEHKAKLIRLEPPTGFSMTVGDVAPHAGGASHVRLVTEWASAAFADWHHAHGYIRAWVAESLGTG